LLSTSQLALEIEDFTTSIPSSMVCLSVCHSQRQNRSRCRLGCGLGSKDHVLDPGRIVPCKGASFEGKDIPADLWPLTVANLLVCHRRCSAIIAHRVHEGWWGLAKRFNHPCTAAMQPFVRLLWPLVPLLQHQQSEILYLHSLSQNLDWFQKHLKTHLFQLAFNSR